jgi:nucleotide-binding universal stress UspA family protein
MYDKILVPLDCSDLAEIALPYAEELAGSMGSKITLIHVSELSNEEYDHMHLAYIEKTVELTKQSISKSYEKLNVKSIKVDSVFFAGHVAEQIVDYAEKQKIGLIIMATHGRSGIRRWIVGSVAAKVVSATEQPMLLIRANVTIPKRRKKHIFKKALVPLDGSKESEAIIPYMGELASKIKTEIVLFHVVAPVQFFYGIPGEASNQSLGPDDIDKIVAKKKEYLDTLGAGLKEKGIKTSSRVIVGEPEKDIIGIADEIHADLVAMSTHGRSGIDRWTLGSTADKVLHGGHTPIMLVRSARDNER